MLAQDWDAMAEGMVGVLEQEARERSLNRGAIANLRRRSLNTSARKGKTAATSSPAILTAPTSHPARGAAPTTAGGKGLIGGRLFAKRPEGRVRRLRSLPGSVSRQDPQEALPPCRPDPSRGGGSTGDVVVGIENGVVNPGNGKCTSDTNPVSSLPPPSSPPSRGGGGEGPEKEGGVGGETALWPSAGVGDPAGRRARRRGRGVPPDVVMTDVMPVRLSCGYCRKHFHVQNLDQHEERCPSRNLDLFATPCVACGLQGPRCACWALRNGLLKETRTEPEKPLFALFKNSREGRAATETQRHPSSESSAKRAAGFLGGWTAGEGIRRPVPLNADRHGSDNDLDDSDDDKAGGCGDHGRRKMPKKTAESAEEQWVRERDDWLFGRTREDASSGPPAPPRAPSCGGCSNAGSGSGKAEAGEKDGDGLREKESDEAFLLRERVQMRSHLEKGMDAAKVRRYTEKWFRFSNDPPEKIRHVDIPWLPRLSTLLVGRGTSGRNGGGLGGGDSRISSRGGPGGGLCLERFETLGVNEGDSSDMKKAALRAASLRWHPDKFMSRYGPRIASEDRSRIAKDVQATMQRITKLRERLHQQGDTAVVNQTPLVGSPS